MGWGVLFLIIAHSSMSHFYSVFKRHMNVTQQLIDVYFDRESSQYYIGNIPNHSNIIQSVYIKGVTYEQVDKITLFIYDQPVQSFTGEWMKMYHTLRTPIQKSNLITESTYVMVPFKKYLPVFENCRIELELLEPVDGVKLLVDYVFTDHDIKPSNMLVEQVQVEESTESEIINSGREFYVRSKFKRPVKEFYISVKDEYGKYTSNVSRISIDINEYTKIDEVGSYFRFVQPLDYHTRVPDYFYTYSFCLDPESEFPTGSINMGRIKNQNIRVTTTKSNAKLVTVYAHSYNILTPEGKLVFT